MADIKLFRPQRLTDNPDGGGLATATEIVDGEVNNLFDDISRVKRVNGELSLRKAFAIAATPDTALYSGVHMIVAAPPLDPRVSAVLFGTQSWDDERADAQAAVERYLDESVICRMIPYDRQLEGQRTVLVFQRPELSLPEIGQVYALKLDDSGVVEFIRVQDIDHEVQTFTDTSGDYQARVITLTISQPLSQEFDGSQPNRFFTADSGKAVLRKTIASDAARFKGVVVLAEDAAVNDLTVKVESIFAQLVPAATTEVAVTDATPDGAILTPPAATTSITVSLPAPDQHGLSTAIRYLPGPCVPGTFSIQRDGGGWSRIDDGLGNIIDQQAGNQVIGTVNYSSGALSLVDSDPSSAGTWASNSLTATYLPAASIARAGQSFSIPVDISNRGYVYVATLKPLPSPGTVSASFRAQGQWYTLQDDGSGALRGDVGVGSGLVNFTTGTTQLTLGALPDIGSAVIISYGTHTEFHVRDGDLDIAVPAIQFTLDAGNAEPGTVSPSWLAGGITKTATDDGTGNFTGDATGRVVYSSGEILLKPTLLPDSNAVVSVDYQAGTVVHETFNPSIASGAISIQATNFPLRENSILIGYTSTWFGVLASYTRSRLLIDNGVGQLLDEEGGVIAGSSVDYATGLISFNPDFNAYVPEITRDTYGNAIPGRVVSSTTGYYVPDALDGKWATAVDDVIKNVPFINGTAVQLSYKQDSAVDATHTAEQHVIPALQLDLTPLVTDAVVPGALLFKLGGRTYYDRAGTLYYGMDPGTGAGSTGGSIDYASGIATLTSWQGNIAPAFDMLGLLTQVAPLPLSVVHGRTPGNPLRPSTFYLQAVRYRDGVTISGLADNNGNIDTAQMHGSIDVNTGVYSVAFGGYVLDSSLTSDDKAEPWYDAANVDGSGYIWRPDEVIPGTVKFNCVVQTTLPLDPAIIKVNPVRLPSDGRVPVFRPGDTLVISDPQPYTMPNPLTAGQVVTLPRTNLDSLAMYDASGLGVLPTLYTTDKAAGTVTMADPLDLSAYTQPLVAIHSVEDMAACLDAQITGQLTLGAPLSHAYTAGQSLVSSALILGDAQARYEHLYEQNTWTSVWSDDLIGSAPTGGAQFNDALYPITVLNADAVTQRWRLNFTSSSAYQVIGETMGVIATGTTGVDCAPDNPATGLPYFTIQAAGFGAGWATGNQLRFNTVAAGGPVWVARTVLSGPATELDDRIRLGVRWDKD